MHARRLLAPLVCLLLAACGGADGSSIGGPAGSRILRTVEPDVRMAYDPHWQRIGTKTIWVVTGDAAAAADGAFADNLALQAELLPAPMSLDAYVDKSIATSAASVDRLKLVRREPIELPSGLAAVRLEFSGGRGGTLDFVAIAAIRGQTAATAILTAPGSRSAAVTTRVEPYMRSLHIG